MHFGWFEPFNTFMFTKVDHLRWIRCSELMDTGAKIIHSKLKLSMNGFGHFCETVYISVTIPWHEDENRNEDVRIVNDADDDDAEDADDDDYCHTFMNLLYFIVLYPFSMASISERKVHIYASISYYVSIVPIITAIVSKLLWNETNGWWNTKVPNLFHQFSFIPFVLW